MRVHRYSLLPNSTAAEDSILVNSIDGNNDDDNDESGSLDEQHQQHRLTIVRSPSTPNTGLKNHPWRKLNRDDLTKVEYVRLRSILEELCVVVEGVSSELVGLLQERDGLQEEVDTRNIAIEQLLKIQEKMSWRQSTPLTVQMSVIMPSSTSVDNQQNAIVIDRGVTMEKEKDKDEEVYL